MGVPVQIKPCNYQLVIKINIDNVTIAGICLGRRKNSQWLISQHTLEWSTHVLRFYTCCSIGWFLQFWRGAEIDLSMQIKSCRHRLKIMNDKTTFCSRITLKDISKRTLFCDMPSIDENTNERNRKASTMHDVFQGWIKDLAHTHPSLLLISFFFFGLCRKHKDMNLFWENLS